MVRRKFSPEGIRKVYAGRMTQLTDQQLAEAFADENRHRLRWEQHDHLPGRPYVWAWYRNGSWGMSAPDNIPHAYLYEFLKKCEQENNTLERQKRILELAKPLLR